MSKKKLCLCLAMLCIFVFGFTMTVSASQEDGLPIVPLTSTSLGAKTLGAYERVAFKQDNASYSLTANKTSTFSVTLNTTASVEIGFYNEQTGNFNSFYSGSTSSRTITYTPTVGVKGYYYVKNNTSGTIKVTSSSMTK